MNRIEKLQQKHPWLSEEKARWVLLTRYWTFTREMEMVATASSRTGQLRPDLLPVP